MQHKEHTAISARLQPKKRRASHATQVHIIQYNASDFKECVVEDLSKLCEFRDPNYITWIDIHGLANQEAVQQIAETFGLHPLAVEDVLHGGQRPKLEPYPDVLFLITRFVVLLKPGDLDDAQCSIFLGKDFVVTFQEAYHEVLDPVRTKIRQGAGKIRRFGSDYLAYSIIDVLIDHYFPVLESLGEYFQVVERHVIDNPTPEVFREVHSLRRELLGLRRTIWPQRDAINSMIRDEDSLISEPVRFYLRDCYDHCIQIIDVTETYRELVIGLVDIYLSSMSNKLNEVMKVLTMIATLFIPLSFITGIYGMNFEYMPELKVWWAYPVFWCLIISVASAMLYYFYRSGWIGNRRRNISSNQKKKPKRRNSQNSNGQQSHQEAHCPVLTAEQTVPSAPERLE